VGKVILDDGLRDQLANQSGSVELFNRAGQKVGYFLTPTQFEKLMYAWGKTQFSDEEAERAWNDYLRNGGVSTQEALERAKMGRRSGETAA
jgi:hypothetical protein